MYLQVASELVTKFKHEIDSYLDLVINTTENELGRCGPMANVYRSVVEATCSRIVNPLVSFIHTCVVCILLVRFQESKTKIFKKSLLL